MTREEAITVLKGLLDNPLFSEQHKAAFNIAIHDIKAHHDWDINNLILINKENYESAEQKIGHWIDINCHHYYNDGDIETTDLRCSCCNEEVEWDIELLHKPYFCENCGADMREVEE